MNFGFVIYVAHKLNLPQETSLTGITYEFADLIGLNIKIKIEKQNRGLIPLFTSFNFKSGVK